MVNAWRKAWPFVPGPVVALALYLLTVSTGGRFLFEERFITMQGLDTPSVAADPWGSLLALHAQPPLMNSLYAITDSAPERLGYLLAILMMVTTILVVDTVRRCGRGNGWAAASGLMYALLPGTVLYALNPYTTTPSAFFSILAVWGVALAASRAGWGVAVSAVGVLGLFLVRASFAWPIVLSWLIALAILLLRRTSISRVRALGLASLVAVAAVLAVVQGHYWASFSSPTLSSWSSENLSNGLLRVGLSDDAKARLAAQGPCFAELVGAGAWAPVDSYPDCVTRFDPYPRGVPVLDLAQRNPPSQGVNYNSGSRIALAADWATFVKSALADEPSALWRVAAGNGSVEGSLALFLGRSDVYYQTLDVQKQSQPWLWHLLAPWSAAFPFLAWFVVIAAAVRGVIQRSARRWLPVSFWFATALLVLHMVPSVLGDYGENQRFRAELDSVLMVAMVVGLGALVSVRRERS